MQMIGEIGRGPGPVWTRFMYNQREGSKSRILMNDTDAAFVTLQSSFIEQAMGNPD